MQKIKRYDRTTVEGLKIYLLDMNNEKTTRSIRIGFPWSGLIFSMSDVAQINWSNFKDIPDSEFPYEVTSKNDGDEIYVELSDRENFYYAALGFKSNKLKAGTTIRKAIKACETIEELEAIEIEQNL